MRCPVCGSGRLKVLDSRDGRDGEIRRRRACQACGHRFTTRERIETTLPSVLKRSGERQSFDSSKVRRSLSLACRKRPVTEAEIEAVVRRLEQWASTRGDRGVTSEEIGERIIHALHDLDSVAYVRFVSVYRSFESVEEFEILLQEMEKAERVNVEGQRTLFEDLEAAKEPDPGTPSGGKGKRRVGT